MSLNIKNVRLLARHSSALLADFFMDIRQYNLAARFFVNSDRKLSEVIEKFDISETQGPSRDEDVVNRAQALIAYLNQILFTRDELEFVDETKELSNFILQNVYQYYDPATLSDLILDSCLNQYDQTLAVDLMEGLRKQRVMSQVMSGGIKPAVSLYVRPKESFALALLYLDLGKVTLARQMLNEIEREYLVQLCVYYSSLLHPEPEEAGGFHFHTASERQVSENAADLIPSLGQLLKITLPSVFLEVLIRLREKDFPVASVIDLIRFDPKFFKGVSSFSDSVDNMTLFQIYMEHLLSEFEALPVEITVSDLAILVTELLVLYLDTAKTLLATKYAPLPFLMPDLSSFPPSPHTPCIVNFSNSERAKNHFGVAELSEVDFTQFRFPWLDKIGANRQDLPPGASAVSGSPPTSLMAPVTLGKDAAQALEAVVRKVQNLLCSPFPYTAQVALQAFQQNLAEVSERKLYGLWIVEALLCPPAGKLEEGLTKLLYDRTSPPVIVEYAKYCCHKLDDWKTFLDKLLSVRDGINREGKEREIRKICRESYSLLLDYLTTVLDPNVFLHLLPAAGSLTYFIPIIETCLQRYSARMAKKGAVTSRSSQAGE